MPKPPGSRTGAPGHIAHHVVSGNTSVSECLKKHFRLEAPRIEELLALGAIYSNQERITEDRPLEKGMYLRLHLQPQRFAVSEIDWLGTIIAEERDFIVVNKPAGIPVHATVDNRIDNVLTQLREATKAPLFITHRLDAPVSGLLVLARSEAAQKRINQTFSDRKVQKRYRAIVTSAPNPGLQVHFMEPGDRSPRVVSAEAKPKWLRCELTILNIIPRELGNPLRRYFDCELDLHSGRPHQIRVQLSALGSPIVGDRQYGSKIRYKKVVDKGIALCSTRLELPKPDGKHWEYSIEPPWEHRSSSAPVA